MSSVRQELEKTVSNWQKQADRDDADQFKYRDHLDDLLFQADIRFRDYVQFDVDGPFPFRLKKWLDHVKENREQKALFRLLRWLIFIDHKQMQSLYRDAYRTKVVEWISERYMSREDLLAADYHCRLLGMLRQFLFCSITESFNVSFFKQVNSLVGLPKLEILSERKNAARRRVEQWALNPKKQGLIVFEDMVGTGNQASKVLAEIAKVFPAKWRCLFIPLIVLPSGLKRLNNANIARLDIWPVLVVPEHACIQPRFRAGEADEFQYTRSLIKSTGPRVLERLHEHDDTPRHAFGYEGSGALVVTSHNTPNNTLPLIHHRAPDWAPLFRRVHHLKDD